MGWLLDAMRPLQGAGKGLYVIGPPAAQVLVGQQGDAFVCQRHLARQLGHGLAAHRGAQQVYLHRGLVALAQQVGDLALGGGAAVAHGAVAR